MNIIEIWAPRWKDRKVLVASWKVGEQNLIRITCTQSKTSTERRYPNDFTMSGAEINKYPTEQIKGNRMRVIPLEDLLNKEQDNEPKITPTDIGGGSNSGSSADTADANELKQSGFDF